MKEVGPGPAAMLVKTAQMQYWGDICQLFDTSTDLPTEVMAPAMGVPHAAPRGAPRPKDAKAIVLAGSCLKQTPMIPNPAGEARAIPRPHTARTTQSPILC